MKRLFVISVLLIAGMVIFKTPSAFSQETVIQTDTPVGVDPDASESATTDENVSYELPYPGILPDNPLYVFKVLRDGIVKALINDPMKKARFSLLNAEKRMYAGKMLIDKEKDNLAIITISKSNNYVGDTFDALLVVKKQDAKNPNLKPFLRQLRAALLKHKVVMEEVKEKMDYDASVRLQTEEKRLDNYYQNVEKLLLES